MDTRTIEYFGERLDKETYTKDDVAKMLHNEAGFTAQQTRKEFGETVSRTDYDELSTSLTDVKAELAPYKEAEFKQSVSTSFGELNGSSDRVDDFMSLGKIDSSMDAEAITAKATEMKKTGKYDFLFTKGDSGKIQTEHGGKQSAAHGKSITAQSGILGSLFGKK